jgi:predicted DNA-binding transcriptional regulator YafY
MNLYNTLKGLIMEVATRDELTKAISSRNMLSIYYAGDMTLNPGWRTIEPVALGLSKKKVGSGNLVLRAWQVDGATDRPRTAPGWRFFRADRIEQVETLMDTFDSPRPNYNPNGDKSMSTMYINAKF